MKIHVAPERLFLYAPVVTEADAEQKAFSKKADAFGTFNKMASFLSKPKDDDFEIVYREKRLVPFWHLLSASHYVFDRAVEHSWPIPAPEVKKITLAGTEYPVTKGAVKIPVLEHCEEEIHKELLVDNSSTKHSPHLQSYFQFAADLVSEKDMEKQTNAGVVVVPPKVRASAIINDQVAALIHSVQADTIFEESVEITHLDLYYRPTFAFEFLWKSKNKKAVVEVDGLTGALSFGDELFKQYLGKVLDADFLFDVGADAAGMVLPGGSIAVKVAKQYLNARKK